MIQLLGKKGNNTNLLLIPGSRDCIYILSIFELGVFYVNVINVHYVEAGQ